MLSNRIAVEVKLVAHPVGRATIWVNFISGPDLETVLECEAVMLHGQKSKVGEVFA
jgi:hypothetical protein